MASEARQTHDQGFSSTEAVQYDRQIRLWGLDAQRRLRSTRILCVGTKGLGMEVCKNLVLAGVGHLVLSDSESVTQTDLGANFYLGVDDLGKNRVEACIDKLRALNPLVEVKDDRTPLESMDEPFLGNFDVVFLSNTSLAQAERVAAICHTLGKTVYAARLMGFYGVCFIQMPKHSYITETKVRNDKNKDAEPEVKREMHTIEFPTIEAALKASLKGVKKRRMPWVYVAARVVLEYERTHGSWPQSVDDALLSTEKVVLGGLQLAERPYTEDVLQSVVDGARAELCPVAAVIGGVLGNEIIKVISGKDAPLRNVFLFDGHSGSGTVAELGVVDDAEAAGGDNVETIEL